MSSNSLTSESISSVSSDSTESSVSSLTTVSESSESSISDISDTSSLSSNSSSSSSLDSDEITRSTLVVEKLTYKDSRVYASVWMDMRYEDSQRIAKYGPALVDFGGTYGNTFIAQDVRKVVNNLKITKVFIEATPALAATYARIWQQTMIDRVNTELWRVRNARKAALEGSDEFELV